jgi:hypothetical protein
MDDLPKEGWNLIPVEFIEPKLLDFLKTKGIVITTISSFYDVYGDIYQPGPIHSDLHGTGDMSKLIWVWGEHHEMSWYKYKANIPVDADIMENSDAPENVIRKYTVFERYKLDKIYSNKIGLPSLIQVGIPHQMITFGGIRRSLTMVLHDFDGNIIPMGTAKLIFKEYIVN